MIRLQILALIYFITNTAFGQNCLPGGIQFTTQAQIDNFASDYPGCTVIEGDVCIGDCDYPYVDSDIENLLGLLQITSIKGNIEISSNKFLTGIEGFSNLTTIEKDLIIRFNDNLDFLYGLENIEVIGGTFELFGNNINLSTAGLQNLKVIRGNMEFEYGLFKGTQGLYSLDSIYGNFYITNTDMEDMLDFTGLLYLGGNLQLSSTNMRSLAGLTGLQTIGGDLILDNNSQLSSVTGLNNVTKIYGDVRISDNENLGSLTPLSSLKEIGGDLQMSHTWYISLTSLSKLERIGGTLSYSSNHLVNSVNGMNKLRYVGGSVDISSNNNITTITGFFLLDTIIGRFNVANNAELLSVQSMNSLRAVKGKIRFYDNRYLRSWTPPSSLNYLGGLEITQNDSFYLYDFSKMPTEINGDVIIKLNGKLSQLTGFQNVEQVHGILQIDLNNKLKTIDAFQNLRNVGQDFILKSYNLDTLHGFTLLDTVGGNFDIYTFGTIQEFPLVNTFSYLGADINIGGVDSLKDLSLLHNLDSIYGDLRIQGCNNLKSLIGIEHLPRLGGGLTLSSLSKLPNLFDLSYLKSIKGALSVSGCTMLKDLKGLDSLKSIHGLLSIRSNGNLSSLEGIQNIDPQSIMKVTYEKEVQITNNSKLSACAMANICEALRVYKKSFLIENNASGCNNVNELNCRDYGLSGTVYYDSNQNKHQDTLEFGVPGINIFIEPQHHFVQSDENGIYLQVAIPDQSFKMKLETGPDWIRTTDSSEFTPTFYPGLPSNNKYDFGIYPTFSKEEILTHVISDPTRCNSRVNFYLRYQNTGTEVFNGKMKFTLDPLSSYYSSDDYPDENNNFQQIYTWYIKDLQPFQHHDIKIVVEMPDETKTGEKMRFLMVVTKNVAGQDIILSQQEYTSVVNCSFDPNDKIVSPTGLKDEGYVLFGDTLQYTIRFQNTGNAAAIDIRVTDTLDQICDMNTFKVINSSFPVKTTLNANIAEFYFANIWLADSLTNEPESHGFVTYQVQTKDNIEEFTELNNEAHIVFDANPSILTNETKNTFVSSLCSDKIVHIDTVICDGSSFMGHDQTGIYFDTISIGNICDSITILQLYVLKQYSSIRSLKLCHGSIYTISGHTYIADSSVVFIDTSYNFNGCLDLITTVNLEVTYPQEIVIDTVLCNGLEFAGYNQSGTYEYNQPNPLSGCTDHVTLHLEVTPISEVTLDTIICEGRQIMFHSETGTYIHDIVNPVTGCNEHLTLNLEVTPAKDVVIDTILCEGMNYNGFDESGIYFYDRGNWKTGFGCREHVTLYLQILPANSPECITGFMELEQPSIHVYPNPGRGNFYIATNLPIKLLDVFSVNGLKVHNYITENLTNGIRLIFSSSSTENLYILKLDIGGRVYYQKIALISY
ncbi:MAG: hypothetical protein WBP41_18170 [Saprospiraceae bacterium]